MDRLKERSIEELREAREALLTTSKNTLTFGDIHSWFQTWERRLSRSETLSGHLIRYQIGRVIQGYETEADAEILNELRARIVERLDNVLTELDSSLIVRPILEEYIFRVKDTKLAAFLKEFNAIKDTNPNFAAIGFRTILTLIIREKAKLVNSASPLATKTDLAVEKDVNTALSEGIFASGEERLLRRYQTGGKKDIFDNVGHKPNTLINKEDLEDAVDLLNSLLPSII